MKIAVIGSGSWGTAAAVLLAKHTDEVFLWSWKEEESKRIDEFRENREYLPGVRLEENIICTHDMQKAVENAGLIVTVVPSPATRTTARELAKHIKSGQGVVNLSKGLEEGTLLRLSEVYREEIPGVRLAVMSGPSHAEEVSKGLPTTNVVASDDEDLAKLVQDVFMDEYFRVYTGNDMIGVELGGALKNVIALCAGICDGLGYGDNTKAALMTRGIAEITRLGVKMGAEAETFAGLSGIGDLIVTCTSMHSRNRRAGILLGQGKSLSETLEEIHMVVEGVNAAKSALALSEKYGVTMPIVKEANEILYNNKNAREAVFALMTRDKTNEGLKN